MKNIERGHHISPIASSWALETNFLLVRNKKLGGKKTQVRQQCEIYVSK